MLIDRIAQAQANDQQATMELIDKFMPLLKKYSRRLRGEDALQDMQLAFISLILNFNIAAQHNCSDGAVVNYISRAVHNEYIKLLNAEFLSSSTEVLLEDLSPAQQNHALVANQIPESFALETIIPAKSLTEQEQRVILMVFHDGYTASEIAEMDGVTRQSINQAKNRALNKLRRWIPID